MKFGTNLIGQVWLLRTGQNEKPNKLSNNKLGTKLRLDLRRWVNKLFEKPKRKVWGPLSQTQ